MLIDEIARQLNPWWSDPAGRLEPTFPRRRHAQHQVLQHLVAEPRRALVVRGPRQVGKSVLLLQCVEDLLRGGWPPQNITYFDFSDERVPYREVSPREVADLTPPGQAADRPRIVLLDEISSAKDWSRWVKQVVDRRSHRAVVTDSSSADLSAEVRESGAGRWDELLVEGLTFTEFLDLQKRDGDASLLDVERRMPNAFESYLAKGGFPEGIAVDSLSLWWRRLRDDTMNKAIRKDIGERHGVDSRRLGLLFRFLIESSGFTADARKLQSRFVEHGQKVDPRSIAKWLTLLEESMLLTRLERWEKTANKKLTARQHPKIYAADHGLVMAFSLAGSPNLDSVERGRAFEALVYRHLREVCANHDLSVDLYRQSEHDEIDFVVHGRDVCTAIEVMHAERDHKKERTLEQRGRSLGVKRTLLVHGGLDERQSGSMTTVSIRRFALDTERLVVG